jgi:hypothetical protein
VPLSLPQCHQLPGCHHSLLLTLPHLTTVPLTTPASPVPLSLAQCHQLPGCHLVTRSITLAASPVPLSLPQCHQLSSCHHSLTNTMYNILLYIAHSLTHPGRFSSATVTATVSPAARPGLAASRPGENRWAPFSTASPARRLMTTSRPSAVKCGVVLNSRYENRSSTATWWIPSRQAPNAANQQDKLCTCAALIQPTCPGNSSHCRLAANAFLEGVNSHCMYGMPYVTRHSLDVCCRGINAPHCW